MGKISVLLADDNDVILARVRQVLCEEFEIVGAVRTGSDAVEEVQRLKPDVLVIDLSIPILHGLDVVASLRSKSRTKVIFLTVHKHQDFVAAAFAAGASAYVAKANVITDLVPAIWEVMLGGKYVSHSIRTPE